ncbi:MAG: M20/M25/M40 family metallo-hydrolase [Actinomycetota bacterium]|nr:M20/M25/M40 family metallo-hydrolase [Actinomycetota bacterium]
MIGAGAELRDEAVDLLRRLIRIDTSNPPGDETPAAELLASHLGEAGVDCELVGPDPERLNLVARVPGDGSGPSVLLMAHTDVVPAPAENWTVPPFEGVVRDGQVVGRGAADMKGELAARTVALAALARSAEPPAGDVVLVAEADEERNTADVGMSWLVRERPELVRCDYALNEGGGTLLELADGRRVVTVSVGEKVVGALRIRIHGTAGHASVPDGADNPLRHLAAAVDALLGVRAPARVTPVLERALNALDAPAGADDDRIAWARDLHPTLADLLPSMTRLTVTPTGTQSFEPSNVIPPYADLICDCRALPGEGEDEVRAHVERALGDGFRYELQLLEPLEGGTESPIETPLYETIEAYVAKRLPGAKLLPLVTPGFTDSHWVRGSLGTVAYGFAPIFTMDPDAYAAGAHGADEALDIDDLAEMVAFHLRVLRTPGRR